MPHYINKDTKIYGSFSKIAGNKGCEFFNNKFKEYNIDAIYKSFSVSNIFDAFNAAKCLKFTGCAIAMPFKKSAIELVNFRDESAIKSKSINTIIFNHDTNTSTGYNTDYYAAEVMLKEYHKKYNKIYILGNGGLSGAVKARAIYYSMLPTIITRKEWDVILNLRNSLIFNCTPVLINGIDDSNVFLDGRIDTATGDLFHKYQAQKQFELYTGIKI